METQDEDAVETEQTRMGIRILRGVETGLTASRKAFLVAVLVLVGVWFVGRAEEAVHGHTVFDFHLIYWLGMSIWIAIAAYLIGATIASIQDIRTSENRLSLLIPWIFFLFLVSLVLLGFPGFRISSMGLFATAAGSSEPARQASFLLFKYHPLNPILPVNLLAEKVSGMTLDNGSMEAFIWNWNYVFLFLIWSVAYGIMLLMSKTKMWPKMIHLFLSAGGLITLITMKSLFSPTRDQMIFVHAAVLLLFVFQILLTYACLRLGVTHRNKESAETGAVRLPPSAVTCALILFLMVPILADLQNQFDLAHRSTQMMTQIHKIHEGTVPKAVAATSISVRSGPAIGDDIVGILPGGVPVPVLDRKHHWVKIGKNRWIVDKFLMPLRKS